MKIYSILLLFVSQFALAQSFSIGPVAELSFQFPVILSSDAPETDSLESMIGRDLGVLAGIEFGIQLDRVNSIHIKPVFYKSGFLLERYDLQLFDPIHPALGEVRDQSQAASKNVFYHHRFMYAGLELEYARQLGSEATNRPLKFGAFGGLGIHYLFRQDLMIITEGFAVDNSFKHRLEDSLFFEGSPLMLTAFGGGEVSYDAQAELQVYGRLKARTSLLPSTSNEPRIFLWSVGIEAGFRKFF